MSNRPVAFLKIDSANSAAFANLAYATAAPQVEADFRVELEDFLVEEQNPFTLSETGEHLWIWLEKRGENSDWVAGELAKWAGISKKNVGMAGQKDRHAVTRQWFSLTLPGKPDPDFSAWPHSSVTLLRHCRHSRKLQKGGLSGNRFVIRLRNLRGISETLPAGEMVSLLEQRLQFIKQFGVPNYFGEQRFGHDGNNLKKAIVWLVEGKSLRMNPNQRGMYLSAMRSWVFNQYLNQRIMDANWDKYLTGDALNLEGSSRWFVETDMTQIVDLTSRVQEQDLHPAGPLIGEDLAPVFAEALNYETALRATYADWQQGLAGQRLKTDYRALRLRVDSEQSPLSFRWLGSEQTGLDLELSFFLPAGSFATAVLRELVAVKNNSK